MSSYARARTPAHGDWLDPDGGDPHDSRPSRVLSNVDICDAAEPRGFRLALGTRSTAPERRYLRDDCSRSSGATSWTLARHCAGQSGEVMPLRPGVVPRLATTSSFALRLDDILRDASLARSGPRRSPKRSRTNRRRHPGYAQGDRQRGALRRCCPTKTRRYSVRVMLRVRRGDEMYRDLAPHEQKIQIRCALHSRRLSVWRMRLLGHLASVGKVGGPSWLRIEEAAGRRRRRCSVPHVAEDVAR